MWFKRHITGIFDFGSRENRQPFWLWVLLVYGGQMVLSWIIAIPIMASMMQQIIRMAEQSRDNPDAIKDHPELVFAMMKPFMQSMMVMGAILAVVTLLLLAAATTRRLHDRNMSGWFAAPIFAWHIISPILAGLALPKMFDQMARMQMQAAEGGFRGNPGLAMMTGDLAWIQVAQWVGLLAQLVLVVFLALPGTVGPNRFGPDPLDEGKLPPTFT